MSDGTILDAPSVMASLTWAAQRQSPVSVSLMTEGGWHSLRSNLLRYDPQQGILQIIYPIALTTMAPPEMNVGQELGISLRRGHKKCVFVCRIVLRRLDRTDDDKPVDTLLLRALEEVRELQRRVYQRVIIPRERVIPCKLWQNGLPNREAMAWPLCTGHLANVSLGGVLLDIAGDQNPRLSVGDLVGVEIKPQSEAKTLQVEAMYRHCLVSGPMRIGLGLQFIGLEHDRPGRSSISELADFVKWARRLSNPDHSPRLDDE